MREKLEYILLSLFFALATSGCAQMDQFLADFDTDPQLQALGPGTVFPTIEDAAIDALIHTYLTARDKKDTERMRAGTIYSVKTGYSYGKIYAANELAEQVSYPLKRQDVARFHMYPRATINTQRPSRNERIWKGDRRSVDLTDPLHRPLFILHPSLVIHEYRGRNYSIQTVAELRRQTPEAMFVVHSH